MEQRQCSGEVAAKRSAADAGADRLSALPDDILLLILRQLGTVAAAARTSILSRSWRRTWTLLPDLVFNSTTPEDLHIREALAASQAPVIHHIRVATRDDTPDSVAAWLPLASRRLSGTIVYFNGNNEEAEEENGAIALPCFGKAAAIVLDLGFLALALPSSGVFTRLTDLYLDRVRFRGTCELGDMVSSPRCPCLRKLSIRDARGVTTLTVHSESLLYMHLRSLNRLQHLSMDAPVLKKLMLCKCFLENGPVANISAPQLTWLFWWEPYDPSGVQLGDLGQLQLLSTNFIQVYGHPDRVHNLEVLMLLKQFQFINTLHLMLHITRDINNLEYLMEEITYLPRVTFLTMYVTYRGHHFGPCSFHLLRLCTGISRLSLVLIQAQPTCPLICICDEPNNWEIGELKYLKEVEIKDLKGAEHEVDFLKQLFDWAVVLKKLRVTFDYSVAENEAKELGRRISSISRPEILKEFYVYRNPDTKAVELLSLDDEGAAGV